MTKATILPEYVLENDDDIAKATYQQLLTGLSDELAYGYTLRQMATATYSYGYAYAAMPMAMVPNNLMLWLWVRVRHDCRVSTMTVCGCL